MTNVLGGESSAKYKNPLTSLDAKDSERLHVLPPKIHPSSGDREKFIREQKTNAKEQPQQHHLIALSSSHRSLKAGISLSLQLF